MYPYRPRYPDPVWHRYFSFGKSALRIVAGICLIAGGYLPAVVLLLIFAEIVGIAEELV